MKYNSMRKKNLNHHVNAIGATISSDIRNNSGLNNIDGRTWGNCLLFPDKIQLRVYVNLSSYDSSVIIIYE